LFAADHTPGRAKIPVKTWRAQGVPFLPGKVPHCVSFLSIGRAFSAKVELSSVFSLYKYRKIDVYLSHGTILANRGRRAEAEDAPPPGRQADAARA
jgi:hypothetical protein